MTELHITSSSQVWNDTYPCLDAVCDGDVSTGDLLEDFVVQRGELGQLLGYRRVVGSRLEQDSDIKIAPLMEISIKLKIHYCAK